MSAIQTLSLIFGCSGDAVSRSRIIPTATERVLLIQRICWNQRPLVLSYHVRITAQPVGDEYVNLAEKPKTIADTRIHVRSTPT